MAIDSESKRRGSVGAGIPGIAPIQPDGSIDEADRAYLSGSYPQGQQPPVPPSATKVVRFFTRTKLSGADCSNAPFILCLGPGLVAPTVCPETAEDGAFSWSTLEVALKAPATCKWVCDAVSGKKYQVWEYCFIYQTGELAEGVTVLGTGDILGASHKGCFAKWVEDLVGAEPHIVTEDGASVFVSPHGCRYPIIGGGGAYAESKQDVLFGVTPESANFVTPTLSIPFTNPFPDHDLLIVGGYSLIMYTNVAASSSGVVVTINANNDEFINIKSASGTTSFISDAISYTGFADGLPNSIVPAGGSASFDVSASVIVPPGDDVSSWALRSYLTAIRKT